MIGARFLGAGIGYRRPYHAALLDEAAPHPDLLEVMPDHFFAPGSEAPLEALAGRYPIVLHDVGLSPGTAARGQAGQPLEEARLDRVRAVAKRSTARFITDHLAFTRAPSGIDLGHLGPLRYTAALLDETARRVARLQDALALPVGLENIAAPFTLPGDFDEPTFLARLVERTGCGVLLDLTNLVVVARNEGFRAVDRLRAYPLGSVMQLHLAGPRAIPLPASRVPSQPAQEGVRWVDTHDAPVDEESLALVAALRGLAPLRAIVIERDDRLPPLAELVAEARRAAQIFGAPEATKGPTGERAGERAGEQE